MDGQNRGDVAENRITLKQVQETHGLRVHREDGQFLTVYKDCEKSNRAIYISLVSIWWVSVISDSI